nr:SDR family NAD(P)-dependent oxidoreductase [Sphingobium terrigena]
MGRAICLHLARNGRAVGVLDRDGVAAEGVAQEIIDAGGAALAVTADIARRPQIEVALANIRAVLGPITILVNNAGVEDFCAFEDIAEDVWDRLTDVNLKGTYHVTQLVLPDMVTAGWGRIVNLSALGAQVGAPNMVHYTATKGGVIAMTRSLAIELGAKGITVNSVSPGFIETPMARRAMDGNLFPIPWEQIVATYPIPRIGQPEDVAAACAFFASDAAGYVTGQLLGVNGGCAP